MADHFCTYGVSVRFVVVAEHEIYVFLVMPGGLCSLMAVVLVHSIGAVVTFTSVGLSFCPAIAFFSTVFPAVSTSAVANRFHV